MTKLLVVDDVPDNVTLLTMDLEDQGYEVLGAYSGEEALSLAESERPDAILLDVMMPGTDGHEVCRQLKTDPKLAHVPVLLVTAKDEDQDVVAGLEIGADDFITKPFNIRILLARLEAALRVKNAHDVIRRTNARLEAANDLLDQRGRRLAELNQAAYDFVDNVAHDFRTPLSVIKEFTSIILEGLAGQITPQQQEFLDIISNSVDDLGLMVRDMLDITRLEAGLLRMRRTSCVFQDIIEHLRPMLDQKAESSKIDLEFSVDEDLPKVYCDPTKINRVLTNLVVNALTFTTEGGHVSVHAKHNPETSDVVVQVSDDGPGIDNERLQLIFERFRQVGTNARASVKGLGMGLNIAKEFVALSFGQIYAESSPGNGSTFSFTIPVDDSAALINRYLKQFDTASADAAEISLITAEVKGECSETHLDEIDWLMHDVLRCTDLIFRATPSRWVLAVVTRDRQAPRVIQRIEESWRDLSNRDSTGTFPEIAARSCGTWQMATQQEEFAEYLSNELKNLDPISV